MLELFTALGLAFAAGINAYIPLLAVGLLAKFTDLIVLPAGWTWMEKDWVLLIFAGLVIIEFVADKVAVMDSINDVLQTAIRPASGGMMFVVGSQSESLAVTSFNDFINSPAFPAFLIGLGIALVPHLLKLFIRPLINATTAGMAAPIVSFGEDVLAVIMVILAVILPVLIPLAIVLIILSAVKIVRKLKEKKTLETA